MVMHSQSWSTLLPPLSPYAEFVGLMSDPLPAATVNNLV